MPEQREPRQHDEQYLAWLRSQPCCICGADGSDAAHLRMGSVNDGKRSTGMGEKSSDKWAVPLCRRHHDMQHAMAEREFWASFGLDPMALSMHYRVRR
jgi:hypothetical protein